MIVEFCETNAAKSFIGLLSFLTLGHHLSVLSVSYKSEEERTSTVFVVPMSIIPPRAKKSLPQVTTR